MTGISINENRWKSGYVEPLHEFLEGAKNTKKFVFPSINKRY